jgi:hypothetical protein
MVPFKSLQILFLNFWVFILHLDKLSVITQSSSGRNFIINLDVQKTIRINVSGFIEKNYADTKITNINMCNWEYVSPNSNFIILNTMFFDFKFKDSQSYDLSSTSFASSQVMKDLSFNYCGGGSRLCSLFYVIKFFILVVE